MKKYQKVCGVEFVIEDKSASDRRWLIGSAILCVVATGVIIRTNRINAKLDAQLTQAEIPIATVVIEKQPELEPVKSFEQGLASYYSREGCLGCSESLRMANGEPLDDTKQTVAYNKAPLGSYVAVTNIKNNRRVVARVTDRGGYEKAGKVIDLSIATRDALGCANTCLVKVERIAQ